jgi:hypothetical protein
MIMERQQTFRNPSSRCGDHGGGRLSPPHAQWTTRSASTGRPSGFAQSLSVTAAPQVLSRDGSSMSTISVTARNADGSPAVGRRLLFSASAGTLLASEVLTANDGRASVVYIAPSQNEPVTVVQIDVTPVEAGDRANTHATSVSARNAWPGCAGCGLHVRPG